MRWTISSVRSPTRLTREPVDRRSRPGRASTTLARLDASLHRRCARRLDPDDPDLRVECLERRRDARDQPAAADRDDDRVDRRQVVDRSRARACPGPRSGRGRRTDGCRSGPAPRPAPSAFSFASSQIVPCSTTSAPYAARRLDLRRRRVLRHHDHRLGFREALRRARRPARGCRPTSR